MASSCDIKTSRQNSDKKSYLNIVSYRLTAGRSLSMSAKEFGPYGLVRRQYRYRQLSPSEPPFNG